MSKEIQELHTYLKTHGDKWVVVEPGTLDRWEFCEHCGLFKNSEKLDYFPHLWYFGNNGEVCKPLLDTVQYSHGISGLYASGLKPLDEMKKEKDDIICEFVRITSDMIRFNRTLAPNKFPKWLFDRLLEVNELYMALEWKEKGLFEDGVCATEDEVSGV